MTKMLALYAFAFFGTNSLAQTIFTHGFGSYDKSDTSTQFYMQAVFQSRNDSKASATTVCRRTTVNSVAVESIGRWLDLADSKFNYEGNYWCSPIGSNIRRLPLKVEFLNNLGCVWKGEAMSNSFAEAKCQEVYGTRSIGKVFGGCIEGPYANHYLFEAICDQ